MPIEWQGDHRLLGDDAKQALERELTRLGHDPGKFMAQVRREPDGPGAAHYVIHLTNLDHPDRETWTLRGAQGENWAAQLAAARRR